MAGVSELEIVSTIENIGVRPLCVCVFISEYGILLMPTTTHLAMNIQTQVCTINTNLATCVQPKHTSLLACLLGSTAVSSNQSGTRHGSVYPCR